MTARDRLGSLFAPDVLEILEAYVDERVTAAFEAQPEPQDESPWLTAAQAAQRLGCSTDAVRMRAKRGRLEARHIGRSLYVSRASVDGTA